MFNALSGFRIGTIAIISSAMLLAACGPTPQPQYTPEQAVQQAAPQIIHQDGFDGGDAAVGAVAGAAAGYMMGRGSSHDRYYEERRRAPARTIIVDRTGSRYYARPQTRVVTKTVTTVKKGWGGKTTITKTTTKRRR